jgi:hypothetical protein
MNNLKLRVKNSSFDSRGTFHKRSRSVNKDTLNDSKLTHQENSIFAPSHYQLSDEVEIKKDVSNIEFHQPKDCKDL